MSREKVMAGINSSALKEFGGFVSFYDVLPDFVELSLAELRIEEWNKALKKLRELETTITIHAPYQNSPVKETRIEMTTGRGMNVVEKVLKFSAAAKAETVVFHCGDIVGCYSKSFQNFLKNAKQLKKLSEKYGVTVVLENLYPECGISRMGETPEELLMAVECGLEVNVDVGHAYIASLHWRRDLLKEFFRTLNGSIVHVHAHNNFGIWSKPCDSHNPLFRGLIDYGKLRREIRKSGVERIVLEVKNGSLEEIRQSMEFIRSI